jgi:pyruvate/2-oxoglutarate dehydrogenase complex dihydrolipoamide dehydrogenase (E3) component
VDRVLAILQDSILSGIQEPQSNEGGRTVEFDAIIIGSGQAGSPLAFALARHGWKVALVERSHLGGTCINTGCTPTKTLVHRAEVAHYARNGARWGVSTREASVELPKIIAQKDALIQRRREGQQRGIDHTYTCIEGRQDLLVRTN